MALRWPLGTLLSIFDRFWRSPGHLLGVICAPVGALLVIFGPLDRLLMGLGPTFESNIVEKPVVVILMSRLRETITFEGSGRPSWSHLVHKVAPRRRPGQLKWRSGQKRRRVRSVRSTCLKDVWDSVQTRPDLSQTGPKNYQSDKSYD